MDDIPPKQIRFGDYSRDVQANYTQISYNDLTYKTDQPKREKIELRSLDVYRLVKP